jgi:transposase
VIRPAADIPALYLCREPIDMRKQIDGLAALVQHVLGGDPFSAQLFVFTNRRRNKIKILCWDRTGFVIWYKRLEKDHFHWPRHGQDVTVTISGQQLHWLLDGYDITRMTAHAAVTYAYTA